MLVRNPASSRCRFPVPLLLLAALASSAGFATAPPPKAGADLKTRYERAIAFQNHDAARLVTNAAISPFWIEGTDAFWYRRETEKGFRVVVADAAKRTQASDVTAVRKDLEGHPWYSPDRASE